jgi:hypothetical protein
MAKHWTGPSLNPRGYKVSPKTLDVFGEKLQPKWYMPKEMWKTKSAQIPDNKIGKIFLPDKSYTSDKIGI